MSLLFLLPFFSFLALKSQDNIFQKQGKFNWKSFETSIVSNVKYEEVSKIKDDLMIYLKENKILEQNLKDFHFIQGKRMKKVYSTIKS